MKIRYASIAGDDALAWEVPETGSYEFSFADVSDNGGCGVSIDDRNDQFWSPTSTCPAEGETESLPDGYFVATEGSSDTRKISEGTNLLVLVSCSTWTEPEQEFAYELTVTKK